MKKGLINLDYSWANLLEKSSDNYIKEKSWNVLSHIMIVKEFLLFFFVASRNAKS